MNRYHFVPGMLIALLLGSGVAGAQPLGTFKWQLTPYCNVVSVAIVQAGAIYRLEGTDDQCGAATSAAATGLAFVNPDGTVGFGISIVTSPGGAPVTVDATVALPGVNGTWRDSGGRSGALLFLANADPGTGGVPRPNTGLGATAVNRDQVQLRVAGGCPAGSAVRGINPDGTVICEATGSAAVTGLAASVQALQQQLAAALTALHQADDDLASAAAVIPSGRLVTGSFFIHVAATNLQSTSYQIELPARAPVALTDATVNFAVGPISGDGDPLCTGTATNPTAPAGRVCLYLAQSNGTSSALTGSRSLLAPTQAFEVSWTQSGATVTYLRGRWAYTAP